MEADQVAAKEVLEPAKLIRPADILTYIEGHEVTHGLYGWWIDGSLTEVPRGGCLEFGGKHLLYIGIAPPKDKPAKPGSATPVKRRLWRNHLHGSVRSSTLRLSLAALLKDQLDFEFYRDARGRVRMTKDHEEQLTTWIEEHAGISVVHHDAPWQLEEALVRNGPPLPLNLSMSGHPFKPTLSALRKALGRDSPDL
ncbi:hypothetical protein J7443_19250 [Tropicibacter sp. R15_0]|uniref:GIY-YIG nuclease family protein n=1 Tax=Tropicibacter sp. R15_0 TaxID=2821101 RepID=UPI001ADC1714|nr:hypothetical protein [Tropicibacter sp. R15_0]MBO9467385.1 hypothetical protein [Tropicibacter sp. R15_0]